MMHETLEILKPQSNDLVVIPMSMELPENFPYLTHRIEFMLRPSIIRSGYGADTSFFSGLSVKGMLEQLSSALRKAPLESKLEPRHQDTWNEFATGSPPQEYAPLSKNFRIDKEASKEAAAQLAALEALEGAKLTPPPPTVPTLTEFADTPDPETFFRHVRCYQPRYPDKLSPEVVLNARGGITFYIELNPEDKFFDFSYSLCSEEDNFDKTRGRNIAFNRMKHGDWYEIVDYDPELSIVQNIAIAIKKCLNKDEKDGMILTPRFNSFSGRRNDYELSVILQRIIQHERYN